MRRDLPADPRMKTRIGTRPYRVTTVLGRASKRPSEAFASGQAPEAPPEESEATEALTSSIASEGGEEFEKESSDVSLPQVTFPLEEHEEIIGRDEAKPVVKTYSDRGPGRRLKVRKVQGGKGTLEDPKFSRLEMAMAKISAATQPPALRPKKGEFAPGIPGERGIHTIPKVAPKGKNQEWTAALQMHPAARRGDHHDLRLVDPKGRAHSWAFDDVPAPGKSTYAAQQPTHKKRYALRDKPFTIPEGYGATRPGTQVVPKFVSGVEVVEADPKKVRFLKHEGQQTQEFVLRQLAPAVGRTRPMWALHNATKNRNTGEGKKIPAVKPKYREVRPEQIDLNDQNQVMTPKIDGAHVLVDLPKDPKKFARVYSYRPTSRETGLIEHTFKFPDFHKQTATVGGKNTMLRAELWATDKDGKALPAEQVGGLLNAGVLKSRQKQQEQGVKLRLTGIDVVRHEGKNFEKKPYGEKLKVIQTAAKATKGFVEAPEVAITPEQKKTMLDQIGGRKHHQTDEGVVLQDLNSVSSPTKAKFRPDHDVYVRRVFDKPKGKAKGHAGGFEYSFTPDGPVAGRVGTGFDQKIRKDMLENPQKYVGRVAKVQSGRRQDNTTDPSQMKALRAPAFKEWHIDKTDPKLMEDDIDLQKKGSFVDPLYGAVSRVQAVAQPQLQYLADEALKTPHLQKAKRTKAIAERVGSAGLPSEVEQWLRERGWQRAEVDS